MLAASIVWKFDSSNFTEKSRESLNLEAKSRSWKGRCDPVDHRDSWLFLSILVGSFNILDQKHLNEVLTVMVLVPNYVDPESVDPVWSWSSKSLVFRPSTCRIINTDISFGCTNYWCSGSILQIGPVWRISCISQGSCAGKKTLTSPKNMKGLLWSRCFGWRSWVRFPAGIMCREFTWTNS